jgi:hypothetical protein
MTSLNVSAPSSSSSPASNGLRPPVRSAAGSLSASFAACAFLVLATGLARCVRATGHPVEEPLPRLFPGARTRVRRLRPADPDTPGRTLQPVRGKGADGGRGRIRRALPSGACEPVVQHPSGPRRDSSRRQHIPLRSARRKKALCGVSARLQWRLERPPEGARTWCDLVEVLREPDRPRRLQSCTKVLVEIEERHHAGDERFRRAGRRK